MATTEQLKRFLSIVVLSCFFLPLCQCSTKAPATENDIAREKTVDVLIPIEQLSFADINDLPLVATFSWPLLAVVVGRRFRAPRPSLVVNSIEVALCLLSLAYIGQLIRLWGEIRYGGITAISCFLGYLVLCLVHIFRYATRKPA